MRETADGNGETRCRFGGDILLRPRWRRFVFYGFIMIMAGVTSWRVVTSFLNNPQIDFRCFVDCAQVTFRGLDYQDLSTLTLYPWDTPQIVFPGMMPFYLPFSWLPISVSQSIYYVLQVLGLIGAYWYFMRVLCPERRVDWRCPDAYAWIYWGGLLVLLNSSPVLTCLRHGQSAVWCMWGVLLVLFQPTRLRPLLFGLTALLKYSMVPVLALLLWVNRYSVLCLLGFLVFVLISLYPAVLGFDLVDFYRHYLDMLTSEVVRGGGNSFLASGYHMLQLEFFRWNVLNMIGKAACGVVLLALLVREHRRRGFGLYLLLLAFCLTMEISYHRIYDMVIVILLLEGCMVVFLRQRQWYRLAVGTCFLGFFLVPFTLILWVGDFLGHRLPLDRVFIMCRFMGDATEMVPLPAMMMLALTIFAGYCYWRPGAGEPVFTLTDERKDRGEVRITAGEREHDGTE
ncbi:MAG: glycosyltransferase family 87 protein [Victivallales bacterium]|nr:glycosyltransferase family 87 protein [Victivallales bacterium]